MNPRLRWKTQAFAAIVIVSNAFGNLSLTWGLRNGAGELTSPLSFLRAIFNPWVSLGICLLNAVLGRLFLGEQVTPARWAGTLLIMAGVILVGIGNPHTGDST
jgi:drug/metabolite transporter (DMT)-like permease